MADRYWVGGTGNWDAATTTNWSDTSGGAGGFSVPTSADNVFLNGSSGAGTVTVTATANCANLDFTGFTQTFAGSSSISIAGSAVTLSSSATYTHNGGASFTGTGTGKTYTSNGKALTTGQTNFTAASANTWTFVDGYTAISSVINLGANTTIDLNSQTHIFNAGVQANVTGYTFLNGATSTINSTASNNIANSLRGNTVGTWNIYLNGGSSSFGPAFLNSGTVNNLNIYITALSTDNFKELTIYNGATLTVGNLNIVGRSNTKIRVDSNNATPSTLAITGSSNIEHVEGRRVNLTGAGAPFYAKRSYAGPAFGTGWDFASYIQPSENLRPAIFSPGRAR